MTPASWMIIAVLLFAPAAGFWIGWRLGRAGPAPDPHGAGPCPSARGPTAAGAARRGADHEWLAYAQGGADVPIRDGPPARGGPEGATPPATDSGGRTYLRAPR